MAGYVVSLCSVCKKRYCCIAPILLLNWRLWNILALQKMLCNLSIFFSWPMYISILACCQALGLLLLWIIAIALLLTASMPAVFFYRKSNSKVSLEREDCTTIVEVWPLKLFSFCFFMCNLELLYLKYKCIKLFYL